MPDPSIPSIDKLSLNDPYPPQAMPAPPQSNAPVRVTGAASPPTAYPPSRAADPPVMQRPVSSPPPPVTSAPPKTVGSPPRQPPMTDEWEVEITSQRENATRTSDPNIALPWAEKVYMFVSISLEDFYRDQDIAATDAGVTPRASTPPFEKGLRDDCVRVVDRFAKQGHPKAIYMRGIWFEYGDFKFPNDRTEAYHAYQAAVKQGFSRAEYRLGKMYEDVGDIKRGIYHYERGVSQGDSAALYVLTLLPPEFLVVNIVEDGDDKTYGSERVSGKYT
jgi:hypothetical protein